MFCRMVLNSELSFSKEGVAGFLLQNGILEAKEYGCLALDTRFVICECASAVTSVRDADLSQCFNSNLEWCWRV